MHIIQIKKTLAFFEIGQQGTYIFDKPMYQEVTRRILPSEVEISNLILQKNLTEVDAEFIDDLSDKVEPFLHDFIIEHNTNFPETKLGLDAQEELLVLTLVVIYHVERVTSNTACVLNRIKVKHQKPMVYENIVVIDVFIELFNGVFNISYSEMEKKTILIIQEKRPNMSLDDIVLFKKQYNTTMKRLFTAIRGCAMKRTTGLFPEHYLSVE
ncbi:hypothetical protein CDIK_1494 [Cucumispora dikerogammari]|nr:hypothetical protein CDIK_1494 [Cucumispora dikerogammari]